MSYRGVGHYDPSIATRDDLILYNNGPTLFPVPEPGYELPGEGFVPVPEHYGDSFEDAEFQQTQTVLADGGDHFGVCALAFDRHEELLWMGNQGGHVTSYYGPGLQKYTSFQVHPSQEVRHLHTFDDGVLALTRTSLRCQMRRGIPVFTHSSENMVDMQCLLQISPDTLLLGGHQDKIIVYNLAQGQETSWLDVGENGCAILRQHGRFICAGDPSGSIALRSANALVVEHTLEAHTGSLSDFDVHGNLLVTCGFSSRQGSLSVDRLLMVYDLRMMRAVTPIQVVIDPLLLRFLPSFSSRLAVVSALGQTQLVDTVAPSQPSLCLYQANTAGSVCLALDVSSSCQCLALGDAGGSVHLYASSSRAAAFNVFSRQTEFADPVEPVPPFGVADEHAPLAAVPLPYGQPGAAPLSDWPEHLLRRVYRTTPPIDPEILRTMKMQGTIGYAPNPAGSRRNQVAYKLDRQSHAKARLFPDDAHPHGAAGEGAAFTAIPRRYRKVDMRYSKTGLDEHGMEHFNKTEYCGLEATLPNSYCNAMIQVLYHIKPVRSVLLAHLCPREFCLSCELGFLFHMLGISRGQPCQSSNFLRAFRTVPEASALGLILSDQSPGARRRASLVPLIQSWNRFVLHQLHYELLEARKCQALQRRHRREARRPGFVYDERDFPSILDHLQSRLGARLLHARGAETEGRDGTERKEAERKAREELESEETDVSRLFGVRQALVHTCAKCATGVSKQCVQLLCNLVYPETDQGTSEHSFSDVVLRSLATEKDTRAWCEECRRYQPTRQVRRVRSLPPVLAMNCGLDNPKDKAFWQTQMDLLVRKALEKSPGAGAGSRGRPCRYGANCSRHGCRFSHGRSSEATAVPGASHLYHTHSWLPLHLRLALRTDGNLHAEDVPPSRAGTPAPDSVEQFEQSVTYDLSAVVCFVNDPLNGERRNLVGLIRSSPEPGQDPACPPEGQWHIFNDFSIVPIPAQEAAWFNLEWKVPCVLYWVDRALPPEPSAPRSPLSEDVFCEDVCLARNRAGAVTFTPLAPGEMPGKGDLVAMDAEFVTLNQEEAELRSDGKMSTIKPCHMSVARITCVRGYGPLEGTPFIDDYISTQEQVVDYLTQFSGISPGDLDANFSSKHLTTLKSTYQKLRFLVDNGVTFVGHGLSNDFRVINLVVPANQVIDTVSLFHLPHQRMVSLRFLAWHFLGLKIQSVTHDSVEDARTALRLYRRYLRLVEEGSVRAELLKLYEVGASLQWKVPGVGDAH
ncbi:PAN2-PAN3 deadenylation complex catalytic subunit PAN2 [Bacillus rossius redtenbacheri]|uniref:PAN2-PAN3 deadenylation complex catalytic subunit PAN2 n=1 Tax=Bacillus rossius redtenbacheri TaxID=93214 RepID=UPI002FDD5975